MNSTHHEMTWSDRKKKIAAMHANISTMMLEMSVSRRLGHVTFEVSVLTCWRNTNGLVVFDAICRSSVFVGPATAGLPARLDTDRFIEIHASPHRESPKFNPCNSGA